MLIECQKPRRSIRFFPNGCSLFALWCQHAVKFNFLSYFISLKVRGNWKKLWAQTLPSIFRQHHWQNLESDASSHCVPAFKVAPNAIESGISSMTSHIYFSILTQFGEDGVFVLWHFKNYFFKRLLYKGQFFKFKPALSFIFEPPIIHTSTMNQFTFMM